LSASPRQKAECRVNGRDCAHVANRPAPHAHPAGLARQGNAGVKPTPGPQIGAGNSHGMLRRRGWFVRMSFVRRTWLAPVSVLTIGRQRPESGSQGRKEQQNEGDKKPALTATGARWLCSRVTERPPKSGRCFRGCSSSSGIKPQSQSLFGVGYGFPFGIACAAALASATRRSLLCPGSFEQALGQVTLPAHHPAHHDAATGQFVKENVLVEGPGDQKEAPFVQTRVGKSTARQSCNQEQTSLNAEARRAWRNAENKNALRASRLCVESPHSAGKPRYGSASHEKIMRARNCR
jgi:hypothetical protein